MAITHLLPLTHLHGYLGVSAERFCHVIVTDLRDTAVTGFTVTQPFDRNENGIDRKPEIIESWSNSPT